MLILTIVYDDVLRLNVKIQKHNLLKLTSATVKILVSPFKKREFISNHFYLFKLILTKILKKYRMGIIQLNTIFHFNFKTRENFIVIFILTD